MDIDDFKKYNDTYGHKQGDTILARLRRLLKATLRSTDILADTEERSSRALLPSTERKTPVSRARG